MGQVRFAGYAAIFGRADRGGDVVLPGAFAGVQAVPLLWQHGGRAIGVIEAIGEDARGLAVIARIDAAEPARLVATGAVSGLSFGYRVQRARAGRFRTIEAAELIEVSVVAQPMQPLARIHAVEDG